MKGLELSKRFFEEYGRPMLETDFADLLPFLAVGLVGSGSECFGFDDELSRDHDFAAGFCIFLPEEAVVSRADAFRLERAYSKLPKTFLGVERSLVNPVGGNRHGVLRTADFYGAHVGSPDGNLSTDAWLGLPEHALCEATNGQVFYDAFGEFSAIREQLSFYPREIARKKLAGNLLLMGQAGQYNYPRAIARGDTAAAQLAVFEFVKSTMSVLFLLEKTYQPYYKWAFCALKKLPGVGELPARLEFLLSSGNTGRLAAEKTALIEEICNTVAARLSAEGLSPLSTAELEKQAYAVNDQITDNQLRNRHVLSGV